MKVDFIVKSLEAPILDVVKSAASTGRYEIADLVQLYEDLLCKAVLCRYDLPIDEKVAEKI